MQTATQTTPNTMAHAVIAACARLGLTDVSEWQRSGGASSVLSVTLPTDQPQASARGPQRGYGRDDPGRLLLDILLIGVGAGIEAHRWHDVACAIQSAWISNQRSQRYVVFPDVPWA